MRCRRWIYDAIDLSTEFLGRPLRLPFLASSMTGGPDVSERINRAIAEAAQAMGFAMGVGSQRISLTTDDRHGLGPELRRIAPDMPIYGNLGAVQLVHGMGLEEARRAVDALGADALILHLNPLQEAAAGGRRPQLARVSRPRSSGWRARSPFPSSPRKWAAAFRAPWPAASSTAVLRPSTSRVPAAPAGPPSKAAARQALEGQSLGEIFRDWGIPTARCLADVREACPGVPLIASGGIRHGLDAAKAIRLGATLAGQAASLLGPAMAGTEAVIAHVEAFAAALRIACLATGSRDLAALGRAELM